MRTPTPPSTPTPTPTAAGDLAALEEQLHRELVGRAAELGAGHGQLLARVRALAPLLPLDAAEVVVGRVAARLFGLGPLEALLAEPGISEVMVNPGGRVWVERAGRIEPTGTTLDDHQVRLAIERVVAPLGLRADPSSPVVDARLPDGSRVHAVLPPVAIDGPCLTIRRFAAHRIALEDACPPAVAALLRRLVAERRNIVVSGGTGAGKTTLLNALAAELPASARVVTIEDAAELRLPGEHVVRLEARPATADGVGATSIRDLVRTALRMRPDRIVVGEVRGVEALDMVQAMNTGHEGGLSTCHANSPVDALRRLEAMIAGAGPLPVGAVRDHLESSIDVVVHVARTADGGRRVHAVAEVASRAEQAQPLQVRLLADATRVVATPERPSRALDAGAVAA